MDSAHLREFAGKTARANGREKRAGRIYWWLLRGTGSASGDSEKLQNKRVMEGECFIVLPSLDEPPSRKRYL